MQRTPVVIGPGLDSGPRIMAEVWRYRDLLYFLAWRDIKVRYKQAVLGIAWAALQPLLTMVVFTVIFSRVAHLPSDGIAYPLFVFLGLLPWQLFASALQRAGLSLVGNAGLLTKVYFPRVIVPISAVLAGLVDFAVAFAILLALMAFYGVEPTWRLVVLVPLILFAMVTAVAVGLWLAALNVLYRDVQQLMPFLVQVWFFASPVVYPTSVVSSEAMRLVLALNPMVGVIQGFRWAVTGVGAPGAAMLVSVGVVAVLLPTGFAYFRRVERKFADVI